VVVQIRPGLQFLRHGKEATVGNVRPRHEKVAIHYEDGDLDTLSPDEFRREVTEGNIVLLVPNHDGKMQPLAGNWREVERENDRDTRVRRQKVLRRVEELRQQGLTIKQAGLELGDYCKSLGLSHAPCERTLREWKRLTKEHESSLSPAWRRCGNRYQGPDELLLEVMTEVVNISILGTDLFTLTEAWRTIEVLYFKAWTAQRPGVRVPRHSVRKLKNFLRAMPWSELMKLRLDGRTARSITRRAIKTHDAGIFWECVEMDAGILNIFVRSEGGEEIGRPVLYVAIDRATGYVVGIYLTIQKPSTLPFVECLRFMYFPKPPDFDEQYGIKCRIEVFGKPILLLVDNGSEFIGRTAVAVVEHLFGDSARCKPMTPEEKPHIERLIGVLKTFIKTLPGATTSSVTGEPRLLRRGEKLLTLEELRGELYRFVYDRYSVTVNQLRSKKSKRAVAPLDIWREMDANYLQPVPVSLEEFDRALCFKRETRNLAHDGINFDGWNYHSDALASMYMQHGPGRYEFSYTDLDATTIYVWPPNGEEAVAAFEKVLQGEVCDRTTARVIKKQIAEEKKELDKRTFTHTLAQHAARKKRVTSSRGRAEQARIDDLLEQAAAHARKTAPRTSPPAGSAVSPSTDAIHLEQTAPRGRKKGAF
jgi:putative transposase